MDVSLCVCTYRRPALLAQLLGHLVDHDFAGRSVELIIVDNDPDQAGRAVAEEWRERLPFPLITGAVTERNIAAARNEALALSSAPLVMIIDDDEWPEPGWAKALFDAMERHDAAAVFGPVWSRVEESAPKWIREGGFFVPREFPDGAELLPTQTYTSNVLIKRSWLDGIPGPFDLDFGRTGGSDAMLFWDVRERGGKLIWAADAVVAEDIPASRAQADWLRERAFSGGQNYARILTVRLHGFERFKASAVLGVGSVLRIGVAAVMAVVTRPKSKAKSFAWYRRMWAYTGQITGIFDRRLDHYRRN